MFAPVFIIRFLSNFFRHLDSFLRIYFFFCFTWPFFSILFLLSSLFFSLHFLSLNLINPYMRKLKIQHIISFHLFSSLFYFLWFYCNFICFYYCLVYVLNLLFCIFWKVICLCYILSSYESI